MYQQEEPAVQSQPKSVAASKRPKIKQSERTLNLAPERTGLKVEHHFVDSPKQAQKLIEQLRQRGFIETGIETPSQPINSKKK